MKRKKVKMMSNLLEIWSDPDTTGIFTVLNNYDVPWKSDNSYESLNLAYYYNHSGQKHISPLVTGILGTDTSLTDTEKTKIGKLVYDIKHKDWQYLYDALFAEYNPIENYNSDLTETTDSSHSGTNTSNQTDTGKDSTSHTGSDTQTHTGTDTNTRTGTETLKDSGTDTDEKTGTEKTEGTIDQTTYHHEYTSDTESNPGGKSVTQNQIYGFNSSDASNDSTATTTVTQEVTTIHRTLSIQTDSKGDPVLDDDGNQIERPGKNSDVIDNKHSDTTTYDTKNVNTEDKTHETTYNTTDTENIDKSDVTSYNSNEVVDSSLNRSITGSDSDTGNVKRTLTQHGNIGVTTSQQMIESEIELRKHNFFEIVFSDIDKYLTLQVY